MKSLLLLSILSICILLNVPVNARSQGKSEAPLNNAAVVKLARAGFKEKTIISIIVARVPRFDLSPDRMIELKHNGVSEKIIVAMLARQEGMEPMDDSWGDDPFTADVGDIKGTNGGGSKTPDSGSTDIFGSSGGVKGRTRSNSGNGSVEGDTVTTGSATVHILRPPTEAGGAGAKLEKTPTLNNDGIQALVEAGFSEGTIIRRIEQSPVEFDLTAGKLDELRKHRVSDKILAAMKAAMGDSSSK